MSRACPSFANGEFSNNNIQKSFLELNNLTGMSKTTNYSMNNFNKTFQPNKTLLEPIDTTNKGNLLHNNVDVNVLEENITEYRINIDSYDRNINTYPNPFNFTVKFSLGNINDSANIGLVLNNVQYIRIETVILPKFVVTKCNNNKKCPVFRQKNNNCVCSCSPSSSSNSCPSSSSNSSSSNSSPASSSNTSSSNSSSSNSSSSRSSSSSNSSSSSLSNTCSSSLSNTCSTCSLCFPNNKGCNEYHQKNLLNDRFIIMEIPELETEQVQTFSTADNRESYPRGAYCTIVPETKLIDWYSGVCFNGNKFYKKSNLQKINKLTIKFYDSYGNPLSFDNLSYDEQYLNNETSDMYHPKNRNIQVYITMTFGTVNPNITTKATWPK